MTWANSLLGSLWDMEDRVDVAVFGGGMVFFITMLALLTCFLVEGCFLSPSFRI